MVKYIIQRTLRSLLTIFLIVCIVFVLTRFMPIEGYFPFRFDAMTELELQTILYHMGLLDPIPVQLFNFLRQLFTEFDLGYSIRHRVNVPVTQIIATTAPVSAQFGFPALFMSVPIGMALGLMMARKKGGIWDKVGTAYITLTNATPALVYFVIIQLYLSLWLRIPMLFDPEIPVTRVLPIFTLVFAQAPGWAMWMRRFTVDESNKDYIKLAKAKGVPNTTVFFKHVFRNAVVPMAHWLPASLMLIISGSIIVEGLYSIPGMGGLLISSITAQDNPLTQALIILFSTIGVFGLLLGDILMAIIDPRIKLASKGATR